MKWMRLISVLFPILVMAAWVGKLNWVRTTGAEVQLAVVGYDPRDLLAGHYLRYTVQYGTLGVCPKDTQYSDGDYCFCLAPNPESGNHEATWVGRCFDRNAGSCPVFIRGNCEYGRLNANIERMYFPDKFTNELRRVPQKSVIKVRLAGDGQGQVTQFLVDGVDLIEYAKGKQTQK